MSVPRPTISDVAEAAGVSRAAVSKVLREAYGVSPQMRDRVQRAIDALGYRPRESARALRTSTRTVGVALPLLRGQFYADVLDGLHEELSRGPYRMIVSPFDHETADANPGMESLWDRSIDAAIVVSPTVRTEWLDKYARRLPTVVVARHDPSEHFDRVTGDDHAGAALVVRHLAGLGHERITHLSHAVPAHPHTVRSPHVVREAGFLAAMESAGLATGARVLHCAGTEDASRDATRALLARGERPGALFVGSDQGAFGAMRALAERGLRVPEDVSVVGYDDTQFASHPRMSLTTVAQHGLAMGRRAARFALERVEGRSESAEWMSRPVLVARSSSAVPGS
ncbi:LacI family DNA-binding transcriptional regulator [Streptomyces sp. NPDC059639]|uniref:LacI family DNA-binding transcriptional regulator n=1 Tax=Streptomyces sp. NPDC059639 TaxID=3346891 RepID=UPI0036C96CA0